MPPDRSAEAIMFADGMSSPGRLLQLFRDGKPRTKAELTEVTGLSRSTIAVRVAELQNVGLLVPVGAAMSSGGRPPAQLAFNADVACVIAIDLGATHISVALTNLGAEVRALETAAIDIADGPLKVLGRACDVAKRLLGDRRKVPKLVGIGIGVPGRVEYATGRPIDPPIMPGWDRFDIPGSVRRRFDVPVVVDNDVNILAVGEHALSWPEVDDLIFVKVATGLGAGIIAGGMLQRGAQGSAGDLGHVRVTQRVAAKRTTDADDGGPVLGQVASGTAIAARLRSLGVDAVGSREVAALVRAGNRDAIRETREAGREVGEALASVVNLLNPAVVVLGGSIGRAGEHLLAGVREVVYRRAIPQATQHLQIVQSMGGETAAVKGASITITHRVLTPVAIDRWITGA